MYTKQSIEDVNSVPIHRFFPDAVNLGNRFVCRCPNCGKEYDSKKKKGGFTITVDETKKKNFGHCFNCDFTLSKAINTYAFLNRLDQSRDFIKIIREIAEKENIDLEEENSIRKPEHDGRPIPGSFAYTQLEESGLTPKDVTAEVLENGHYVKIPVFQKGSLDVASGEIDPLLNEMVILYYDLEGRRRTYLPQGSRSSARQRPYTRVRWSNPGAHPDKDGKGIKYQTPVGAKAEIYIPQKIRDAYKNGIKFDTLFIHEGEKKAEKASKHGIYSVAIQGIYGLGRKQDGILPIDIQYIAQRCDVKNIVMLYDADWNDLSKEIEQDDEVDKRPKQFAKAAIKFKKFVKTLHQAKIHVDIWFGHVNKNESEAKGVDDLLCTVLKGKEERLLEDIEAAMISVKGEGEYITLHNISTSSETQILDFWNLNSNIDFFEQHRQRLLTLKSFKFAGVFYNVEGDSIKKASEYGSGKEFWVVEYDPESGKKKIDMTVIDIKAFLEANGYRSLVDEEDNNVFVRIDRGVIKKMKVSEIHRFIFNYVFKASRDKDIPEYFARNMEKLLSQSKLCLLEPLVTSAGTAEPFVQRFYYRNTQIAINDSGITVEPLRGPVWSENQINRDFARIQIFKEIKKRPDGNFTITLTPEGEECEFLRYLINTSTFDDFEEADEDYNNLHLINKITCIGYLLRSYKSYIESKVIVAMDAKMSEVGASNGRSGKSIVGVALKKMLSQVSVGARELKESDDFILSEVRKTTANIFIDDANVNFNIGRIYSSITGDMTVNVKGGSRFTIPFESAPKFYITTNHALKSEGDSTEDRIVYMAFSSHYNINNTPAMEFGHQLFSDWDERQWILFDNLMMECVFYYMKAIQLAWGNPECGAIHPPMQMINLRRRRQEMGEAFLLWAESFFSEDGPNLNFRHSKKEIFKKFHEEIPGQQKFVTATSFKKKIYSFCNFYGYHFNPHKPHKDSGKSFNDWILENPGQAFLGDDDKSNGIEYVTVANKDFFDKGESTLPY